MLTLPDRSSIEAALRSPLEARLRAILVSSLSQCIGGHHYDLTDRTHLVVIEPGDTIPDISSLLGFSPLEREWDILRHHDGWFELVMTIGNGGFALALFIADDDRIDPSLLAFCRANSTTLLEGRTL